jgi:hypothetical protein
VAASRVAASLRIKIPPVDVVEKDGGEAVKKLPLCCTDIKLSPHN